MRNLRASRRYADALMMAAEQTNTLDTIARDVEVVAEILAVSREFRLLITSPVISEDKKAGVFTEVFQQRVGKDMLTFLQLLVAKRRESLLPEVIEQFRLLRDEKLGIVNVDVNGAVDLTPEEQQRLQLQLEQYTRKKVRIRFSLDKAIKGGLVVRVGDTVLDASVRHQLDRLRKQLAERGPILN